MIISKGIQDLPSKDLIYGIEGVGKTSLASTYPTPIFIDCEGSTSKLDVSRLEVKNYESFKTAVKLICSAECDSFKSVVIDTTDWLENIVIGQILKEDDAKTITDKRHYSFGAGDKRIEEFFRTKIIPSFEFIMKQGKNIVLVSHAHIKGVDDPVVGRYDHYTLKMGKTASAVLKEWVNNVFFMNYEVNIKKNYGIGKDTATGGKDVFVYTQRTPQYNAKRRDKLADKIRFAEGVNPYPQIIGVKPKDKEDIEKTTLLEVISEPKEDVKGFKKES
jgi:hypothetical protein